MQSRVIRFHTLFALSDVRGFFNTIVAGRRWVRGCIAKLIIIKRAYLEVGGD